VNDNARKMASELRITRRNWILNRDVPDVDVLISFVPLSRVLSLLFQDTRRLADDIYIFHEARVPLAPSAKSIRVLCIARGKHSSLARPRRSFGNWMMPRKRRNPLTLSDARMKSQRAAENLREISRPFPTSLYVSKSIASRRMTEDDRDRTRT